MSSQQFAMLERLEDLVDYFLRAPAVTIESLGRSGEKLAQLAKQAFLLYSVSKSRFDFDDIDSFLDHIHTSFDPYSQKHRVAPTQPSEAASSPDASRKGHVRVPSAGCVAKPVFADRIKWKLAPSFDPSPYLSDPVVRQAFIDPDVLRRPSGDWPKLPRAKVHATKDEVLRLAAKWDARHACQLVPCAKVNPQEAVGIFAVPKDSEFDRLILNPTVVNSRCHSYSAFTKTIAPGYLIALIRLEEQERLLISSDGVA